MSANTPMRRWLLLLAVSAISLPVFQARSEQADPTTGDPQAATIEFKVPGSKPSVTSKAIVVTPEMYAPEGPRRYPVVYLLHGYSGNQRDWYVHSREARRPLAVLADRFGVIIVCPNGKFSSWYLDVPSDVENAADWQTETELTRYLIPEIDRRYRTLAEAAGRAIVGLSMGGHGAIYLAARHPELFCACGSISGLMDLRNSRQQYDLAKRLGPLEQFPQRWTQASALTLVEKLAGRRVGVMIDCGWDDPFMADTRKVHEKMLSLKIPHDYVERPGAHTWEYWINALPYHLQFVSDRLKGSATSTAPAG